MRSFRNVVANQDIWSGVVRFTINSCYTTKLARFQKGAVAEFIHLRRSCPT